MDRNKLTKMAQLAGVGEMALDEVVRVRAQALNNTLTSLTSLLSALHTVESNADAQFRDLEVAIVRMKEQTHV